MKWPFKRFNPTYMVCRSFDNYPVEILNKWWVHKEDLYILCRTSSGREEYNLSQYLPEINTCERKEESK